MALGYEGEACDGCGSCGKMIEGAEGEGPQDGGEEGREKQVRWEDGYMRGDSGLRRTTRRTSENPEAAPQREREKLSSQQKGARSNSCSMSTSTFNHLSITA